MRLLPAKTRERVGLALRLLVIAVCVISAVELVTSMPDKSHTGPLPVLTQQEVEISSNLRRHVAFLAGQIGQRNLDQPKNYKALQQAAQYVEETFQAQGFQVSPQEYREGPNVVKNLAVEVPGGALAQEIIVVGAHYDTFPESPGADDNASGVATLLELAPLLRTAHLARTVRLVAFVNEEPPYFQTGEMGSWVYAKRAHGQRENIVGAISIESVGIYSDAAGSQHYPPVFNLLYPSTGNFICFVGNLASRTMVRKAIRAFRQTTGFPSEGAAAPGWISGVGWSDQWSFWQEGYPAIMITDTAPFRNQNYHQRADTPEKLDYDRTARVLFGISRVITDLGK